MKMDKKNKSFIFIYGIVAVTFILLYSIIPFQKPGASWVMFVFSVLAIIVSCGVTIYSFGKDEPLMSKFYGFPLFRIGVLYVAVQLGTSLLVFVLGSFFTLPAWIGFIFSLIFLGFAAIGIIVADNVKDVVEEIESNTVIQTRQMSYFKVDIMDILDVCEDQKLLVPLRTLADKFKYSDPVSIPETEEKEREIKEGLSVLKELIVSGHSEEAEKKIKTVSNLLSSRNRIKGMSC